MKVTGIIMECNPFHEGHAYLLREARRLTGADYIVAAMSGDFVQRGEPAIFDKYFRAEQILGAGADLVLELPLYAACGSAEYFARGGISLLEKLGVVTDLCFGSESGDIDNILRCAQILASAEGDVEIPGNHETAAGYREILQVGLKEGKPFPAARANALEQTFGANRRAASEAVRYPSVPNDLLAVEYCRALLLSKSAVSPHAVRRIDVPPATEHRKELLREREALSGTGQALMQTAETQIPVFPIAPDDFSGQLLYALRMHEDDLEQYADVSPALASRIRRHLVLFPGYSGFCDLLKTRNLTRTRVSRCLLHILLQIRQERLDALQAAGMALYARPLALKSSAAPLLSSIRSHASVPFLPKLSGAEKLLPQDSLAFLREDVRAEELYCLTLAAAAGRSGFCSNRTGAAAAAVPRAAQRKIPVMRA